MTPRTYEAPGPGTWEQDSTHFARPVTQYIFDVFREPFQRGFKEGSGRYGLLFSHLEPARINGFLYYNASARVINHADECNRLRQGDVLVTPSTSSAFNVVLPLLGAIVTDRGGQLSHAAIVAREYGIPAVVGTVKATSVIPDGARVTVDGTAGTVEIV